MGMVKIFGINSNSISSCLKGHRITLKKNSLLLELSTDDGTISYEIKADMRYPDISVINKLILAELDAAFLGERIFTVTEHNAKMHIAIGDVEAGNAKEFAAQKIEQTFYFNLLD